MPANTAQPEPVEGPRIDDGKRPDQGKGDGVSAQQPAEGADDVAPATDGSTQG